VTRPASEASAGGDWTPIRVERLFEKVAARVETDILEARLLPGQKLPNETELGRRLGVGRSAVREALKTLELRGLLEVRRGFNGGTFVRASDLNEAPFELHLSRWPVSTEHDLLAVRLALEPLAARLAATRSDVRTVPLLERILEREGQFSEHPANFVENATAFHIAVGEASGNRLLGTLVESLGTLIKQQLNVAFQVGDAQLVLSQHRAITIAIRRQNPTQAGVGITDLLTAMQPRRSRPAGGS
jgi:GntR family transcriptional regulator, transcriptional repressor for pyruvate dehydrogenase complex